MAHRREKCEKQWSKQWNNDSRVQINESINKQVRDKRWSRQKRFIHKRETDTNNREGIGGTRIEKERPKREREIEKKKETDIESGSDARRISSEGSVNRYAVDDLGKTSFH